MLTDTQKQNRLKGIGASEVAALFGMHPYTTPYQIWLEKTGRESFKPDETTNNRLWWGSRLEDTVAERYQFETGETLTADAQTRFSPLSHYLLCHIDRENLEQKKLVEIKIAQYNPNLWGESGSSEIPPQYQLQVQAQLACSPGFEQADLCVFFYQTLEIKIYHIRRNDDIIQKIADAATKFWQDYVLTDQPPRCEWIEDVKLAYPQDNAEYLDATPFEMSTCTKLAEITNQRKALQEEEKKLKTDLIVMMGEHAGIKDDGKILCTYKTSKNGNRLFKLVEKNIG